MGGPDTRDLTAAECAAAKPTGRALYAVFGVSMWRLADGEEVAGAPRPGRYVRRERHPGAVCPCPYWIREELGDG